MPEVTANDAIIQMLYDALPALPHPEYGVINMLPFAHDTDATRMIRRQVCEAIVSLLDGQGFIKHDVPQPQPLVSTVAKIRCRTCHEVIAEAATDSEGSSDVFAPLWIQGIASLNAACPHGVVTPDDMRQHMELAFNQVVAEEKAAAEAAGKVVVDDES